MLVSVRRVAPATLLAVLGSLLLAAPSHAADTGAISGTVTARPAGGAAAPYADAHVVLDRLQANGDFFDYDVAGVRPEADGTFSVAGLADGRYQIRTYPDEYGELGQYGYEYYDDRPGPSDVTLVTVSNGAVTALPKTIELQPIGQVTGRVLDEHGEPVAGEVYFQRGQGGSGVTVDAAGRYDTAGPSDEPVLNLLPGTYTASFYPADTSNDAPVYYWRERTVTVTAGGTATLDFTLEERPTATFTVRGSDGQPAVCAPVMFWMRDGDGPWRSPQYGPITTDQQGRFRVTDQAEQFRLRFSPADRDCEMSPIPGSGDAVEYWDGAYAFRDATVVSFAGDVPMSRSYDVQLGAPTAIRPGTPTITGTARVGQTLTLSPGAWTPGDADLDVEWFAGDDPVGTGPELTIGTALEGQWIWARVTGSVPGQASVDATADFVGPVTAGDPPVEFSVPTISGTARIGNTLTAQPGAWGPAGVTLTYQWLADGAPIDRATDPTLELTPATAPAGARVSVRVTGSLPGRTSVSRTSTAVAVEAPEEPTPEEPGPVDPGPVDPAPAVTPGAPAISGAARVGTTMTAQPGAWGPGGVQLSYQWFAADAPIAGATDTAYSPTNAVAGKALSVRVTGTLAGAPPVTRQSAPTAPVVGKLSTTRPKVTGKARQGRKLVARAGAWRPAPVQLRYQWLRDGKPIKGSTARTYRLGKADVGHRVSVRVTGRRPSYAKVALTSPATKKVRR